ncbi:hypothetical protein B488_05020 [Liberibacter crescens BT-1]|uniref:IrrE N-terminal-like domain-containing protein n=2 Tax=Liberibacter crescens TaxID=1273132 RepID=L0ESL9_LIBCB|nr:hypothetical protein B488_05020 [Liberibacter crescens BT-1]
MIDSKEDIAFTIGHEIGHWILHKNFSDPDSTKHDKMLRLKTDKETILEAEADFFSLNLLMPYKLLMPIVIKGINISSLASIFCVSKEYVQKRLENIDAEVEDYLDAIDIKEIMDSYKKNPDKWVRGKQLEERIQRLRYL